MHEVYEYREIRVAKGAWADTIAGMPKVAEGILEAGGLFVALFAAEIGAPASDGVVLTAWPGAMSSWPRNLAVPGADTIRVDRLQATVRPLEPPPTLDRTGVYAHRWFELAERDWSEFLALSERAWPDFEALNEGTRIVGFFRDRESAPGRARVLLLTRYPSLAVWESSRTHEEAPREGADPARYQAARDAFRRRHELTDSTVVRTYRLRV